MKSEFLIVARDLLQSENRPMRPREIVDLAFERGLFSDNISGKTPHQTMKSKLSVYIRKHGQRSIFVRAQPGRFFLRNLLEGKPYPARPLLPPNAHERVLVFRTKQLDELMSFQGISRDWKSLVKCMTGHLNHEYRDRLTVEQDGEFTQVLTYIMVTRRGHVLAYRRGTYNRVESFLRGSYCVGFGGHVTEADTNLFNADELPILDSAIRELSEELKLPGPDVVRLERKQGLTLLGILNDDSSDIGRRHLAFVLRYDVSDDPAWSKPLRGEKSITQLRWLPPDQSPRPSLWNFEYWSQLCLRTYSPKLVIAQPSYRLRYRTPLKPPHLLCVIGQVGSGKSEATRTLTQDFGYCELNSGQTVAELIGVPPIPQTTREEFQALAAKFVECDGGTLRLAQALWARVEQVGSPRVLIDGIRQKATLDHLRILAANRRVGIVYVETPPDVAFEFYKARFAHDCPIQQFIRVREAAVESQVRSLINEADAVLYNWTGKVEYRTVIHSLMRELGVSQ